MDIFLWGIFPHGTGVLNTTKYEEEKIDIKTTNLTAKRLPMRP